MSNEQEKDTRIYWVVMELDFEDLGGGLVLLGDYELYDGDYGAYSGDYCHECGAKAVTELDAKYPGTKFGLRFDTNPCESSSCCECDEWLNPDDEEATI